MKSVIFCRDVNANVAQIVRSKNLEIVDIRDEIYEYQQDFCRNTSAKEWPTLFQSSANK